VKLKPPANSKDVTDQHVGEITVLLPAAMIDGVLNPGEVTVIRAGAKGASTGGSVDQPSPPRK